MNNNTWKKTALFLIAITLLSLFASLIVPRATATPAELSITPQQGIVGDTLVAHGTIDTPNGTFTVRWDRTLNFTGTAVGSNATTSFGIPSTVGAPRPLGRNVTVELIDDTLASVVATKNFTLFTAFYMQVGTPSPPKQLQEGTSVRINVTVTGSEPNAVANITVRNAANQTHSKFVPLSPVSGSGSANVTYPTSFPTGANMNYTGIYKAFFNETTTQEFSVGLTDKTEYHRSDGVKIQAAGYKPSETVRVNIVIQGKSVPGWPANYTASSGGLVAWTWTVPLNATSGTYRMTLTNTTTTGTFKVPPDDQGFNVTGVRCFVKAMNLADEAVAGASIEVYNQTAPTVLKAMGNTNGTGWIQFNLDQGNYTFKGFVKDVEVGLLANRTVTADIELNMQLRLIDFEVLAETVDGQTVPLIDMVLKYNRTTRDNTTIADSSSAQTNATGRVTISNLFVNKTYQVEASRYGMLFKNTTVVVQAQPVLARIPLNFTLPTLVLNIHAIDAKDSEATQILIEVFEWTSGVTSPLASMETTASGDVSFSLPFGRYILRAYRGEDFLNEAVVDLNKPVAFTFDLSVLNVDVAVFVFDYFNQPLANAEVKIERLTGQGSVLVSTKATGGDGAARFSSILGGNFRVSVYVGGQLVGEKTQFLGKGSEDVNFVVGQYVNFLGFPILTGTFALIVFLVIIIIVALILARRRILSVFRKQVKK